MLPLVYVMLVAGCAHAHDRSYDARNLEDSADDAICYVRKKIEWPHSYEIIKTEIVECPVCQNASSWLLDNEQPCPILRFGKTFKECKHGAFTNTNCGNRRDCYRGPGEECRKKKTDFWVQECVPNFMCEPTFDKCVFSFNVGR